MATKRKKQAKATPEVSAEEKIMQAARKVFTEKGFEATRTRDIAKEAGINLALLNYYYRSKEKLFEVVMKENFGHFLNGVLEIANNEQTTWQQKVERLVAHYTDMLLQNPGIPLFVLNEARSNPGKLKALLQTGSGLLGSSFIKQLQAAMLAGEITPVNPQHLLMNIMGLTVFPFASAPMLKTVTGITDERFNELMEERKQLVPYWVINMLSTQPITKTRSKKQ